MTDPHPAPPLRADSPITLYDGRVVPRYRPPEVGGGSFEVDLDQAPQAIRQLEEAAKELIDIRRDAEALGRVTPPTRDQVSLDAAAVLGVAAVGGNGSLLQALDEGIRQVNALVAALQSSLEGYRGTDDENRASMSEL